MMRHFKKRTIALVLASVVTVVGAFGAENYKNSLMSLKFESGADGAVNMTLHTKRDYARTITPIKKDATTYVIMLPDTNSQLAGSPEISGNVESVDVKTMPYTTNSNGYTKITVKTFPNALLTATKAIYIPDKSSNSESETRERDSYSPSQPESIVQTRDYNTNTIHSRSGVDQIRPVDIKKSVHQFEPNTVPEKNITVVEEKNPQPVVQVEQPQTEESNEILLLVLGILLVGIICIYLFVKGKNKMAEILGEQADFDISDEPKKKEKKEKSESKKIRKTINKLDKMYAKPTKMPINVSSEIPEKPQAAPAEEIDESLVVDLDELFQEKTKQEVPQEDEDENLALEDFLTAFSFMDETEQNPPIEEDSGYDEELYEKYINSQTLKFSEDDIKKIEKLLSIEINDETIKNINKYLITNPIEKKPSRMKILENFVTTYTVDQNVSFSKDDVDALYKLISVELDSDFVTDLRTNPEKILQLQKEAQKTSTIPHKTSEILTLNVKDMLPNLSEALKKQGRKKIESEVQPEVVYFSEGYEVSTLSVDENLPNLSIEINNEAAYASRPSDVYDIVEEGYDFDKMKISGELPDLADVIKNPEKYEEPEEEIVEIDENALLNNIANVEFKPFDDGTRQFEVINDLETEKNISDIPEAKEQDKEVSELPEQAEQDDSVLEELFVENKPKEVVQKQEQETKVSDNKPQPRVQKNMSKELIKSLEEKRAQRAELLKNRDTDKKPEETKKVSAKASNIPKTCSINGEEFKVVSSTQFGEKTGCYLGKNMQGYCVIGYMGEKVFKLKKYETLKSENLQSRLSEKLKDGADRYIVRLGANKFILNVTENKMEFVMDLC